MEEELRPEGQGNINCKLAKSILSSPSILRKEKLESKTSKKEGFDTLQEFQAARVRIHHGWNPNQIVTVYEFKLVNQQESQ